MNIARRTIALLVAVTAFSAPTSARGQEGPAGATREAGREGRPSPGAAPDPRSALAGGVPTGTVTAGVLPLSLEDAIARGLANNLGARLAGEATRAAQAERTLARGALLPRFDARLGGSQQEINLEAYGFPVAPGESPIVGPFNVLDARAYVALPLVDVGLYDRSRAGREGEAAARAAEKDARDAVAAACASSYLAAAIARERIDAVQLLVDAAEALHGRALELKNAGVVSGIEVLRAQVERESQRQRLIVARNDFEKAKLALARAIGLPLAQPFELTDRLPYAALARPDVDAALARALAQRPDVAALDAQVRAQQAVVAAERAAALPSLRFSADLGMIGPTTERWEKTYTVAAGLGIPLYTGGRIRARTLEAQARLAQLEAQRADLGARVEQDVRAALLDVEAADQLVQVSRGVLDLAKEQMRQAQDRFEAGVASNLEVTDAQESVARSVDRLLSALQAHQLAKISLARALGIAETSAAGFLLGTKDGTHG